MKQQLNEQFLRMQKLAGIITEGEYRENTDETEDPNKIAQDIAGEFEDYIVAGSPKYTYGPNNEGAYGLEFQLEFDNLGDNTPEDQEEELESQIGGYSSGGPGRAFSQTSVSYEGENNGKYIFSVHQRGGYDI